YLSIPIPLQMQLHMTHREVRPIWQRISNSGQKKLKTSQATGGGQPSFPGIIGCWASRNVIIA
ncbi:MAG TPA: hypothetical protein VFC40_02210, partial [Syntrophomonas sp.]|nr:hypothetical protein [Syntrophomonas sp.]